jgi:Na+/H+ antiporter NhaD/arsenite permease-like protein
MGITLGNSNNRQLSMYILMIAVFVIGYAAIAFEHSLKIDKAAAALITGVLCWAIYVLGGGAGDHGGEGELLHHLSEISSILFFLLGAMTIVEVVDAHEGFSVITNRIKTNKIVTLMWIICWLTFFFSAILDNLTTSIVMISLLKKLVDDKPTRWIFAGMVIIAANAGGAFSPIGDVTTTMLWIGGQVSTGSIITHVFFPSIIALLVPLLIISTQLKGEVTRPVAQGNDRLKLPKSEQTTVFTIGVLGLLFVPVFKTVTHLPPFMGMMLSLGVLWIITDLIHKHKPSDVKQQIGVLGVLRKIDTPSVLFFLGILLAVAGLQSAGHLTDMATLLDNNLGTDTQGGIYAVASVIGLLSSIVDNVPLVAASMGMYPLVEGAGYFSQDGLFWQFLAYCAGTGGSVLIIGSAAGVAVMGLERIPFGWYLKRISLLALIGYVSGIGAYIFQNWLIG